MRWGGGARGFTLIELMVGITVMAVALGLGVPGFLDWLRNSRVRTAAESLQNGLNLARAEAVRRNAPVRFQLVSTLDNTCTVSTTGRFWVANLSNSVSPASTCAAAVNDQATPFLLQKSAGLAASNDITVTGSQAVVTFNSLGVQMASVNPTAAVAVASFQVGSSSGTCVASAGSVRCLTVNVTPGGQVRMCDPSLSVSASNNNPMAC